MVEAVERGEVARRSPFDDQLGSTATSLFFACTASAYAEASQVLPVPLTLDRITNPRVLIAR
jgi:hypothetical protein